MYMASASAVNIEHSSKCLWADDEFSVTIAIATLFSVFVASV